MFVIQGFKDCLHLVHSYRRWGHKNTTLKVTITESPRPTFWSFWSGLQGHLTSFRSRTPPRMLPSRRRAWGRSRTCWGGLLALLCSIWLWKLWWDLESVAGDAWNAQLACCHDNPTNEWREQAQRLSCPQIRGGADIKISIMNAGAVRTVLSINGPDNYCNLLMISWEEITDT